MQISLKWMDELVNIKSVKLEDLIDKLTLGGFEVEEVLEIEFSNIKTTALEISATANRSDSLSIQGLSVEITALLDQSKKISNYSRKAYSWLPQIQDLCLTNLKSDYCSDFIMLSVENLNNFTSPKWLQQKLLTSNIIPENTLIDFKNYILLETGYPLEFYDFDKIYSTFKNTEIQFHLTTSDDSVKFLADNNNEYNLDSSVLILKINKLLMSIAGIIASKNSCYSPSTKSLLIEGSIFNAAKIRQESRILGIRTDRSSRYEKSLKNTNLLDSLYRVISLLRINNPKLSCKLKTINYSLIDLSQVIELNYTKIKQVLGPIQKTSNNQANYEYISPQLVTNALKRLQFQVNYESKNYKWNIISPHLRSADIIREIDLIEEIGRIYGFNNFLTRLPYIKKIGTEDFSYKIRKKLASCLINLGLTELIQYSLVNEEKSKQNSIKLINPLVKDYANLRSSLLPNLIKAVEENLKKNNSILEAFEYGHIFFKNSSSILVETEYVSGIFGGIKVKSNWSESSKFLDWFEAKGIMDQLFKKLNIITYWQSDHLVNNIFHSYRTANLLLSNGQKLGVFGQLSPILAKNLNISIDTYLFEFNFELIQNQIEHNKLSLYREYSLYPSIIKDLSFVINDNVSFHYITELLHLNGSHFLKEIHLLDKYRGKSIPIGYTSLCLQLVFQSNYETLQNQKIERLINNLINALNTQFQINLRN